jgi:hypothetical protein
MNIIFFLYNSFVVSGLFRHLAGKLKATAQKVRVRTSSEHSLMRKNQGRYRVFLIVAILLASLMLTSCVALLYDLIEGGNKSASKYSITVNYLYSGIYSVSTSSPLYIAVFGYYFSGNEPDIVYPSSPLTSPSGSYTFSDLEELSYGVIMFLDFNMDGSPSTGEPYEFYDNVGDNPSEIYLYSDLSVDVSLDDTYMWVEGFYEDFDDGVADNWFPDGSRWTLLNYTYVMRGTKSDNYAYSYYNDDFGDFAYEVSVMQKNGDLSDRRGIFFRAANPSELDTGYLDGYLLWIDSSQNWGFERNSGGVFITIDSGTSYNLYTGMGSTNYIRVECYGSGFDFYFNGYWEAYASDNQFSFGKVGIFGFDRNSMNNPNEFWFDNAWLN